MKNNLIILFSLFGVVLSTDLESSTENDNYTCNYGGREYKLGEHIETPETACYRCTCHKGFEKPSLTPPSHCAIIDCPWGYYHSKPHCNIEYIAGKCCPELRCSAPPPNLDAAFLAGKRLDDSTDGYEITAKVESELTIYCRAVGSNDDFSDKNIEWKHTKSDGSEIVLSNTTETTLAFFPPSTWGVYFPTLRTSDDGLYTCTIPTSPPQTQTTRIIVTTEPRPPVIDPICYKPAFTDVTNDPCPIEKEDLPWYYNTTSLDCTQHIEYSCKWAKENHFATMSACWDYCLDDCYASSDPGPCDAIVPRYYYSHVSDKCESFNYGGCGGNRNNFQTLQECEDKCANIKYRQAPSKKLR